MRREQKICWQIVLSLLLVVLVFPPIMNHYGGTEGNGFLFEIERSRFIDYRLLVTRVVFVFCLGFIPHLYFSQKQ